MRYRVILFPPRSKKMVEGTFVLSIWDKDRLIENSLTFDKKKDYLEFEVPDDVEYKYDRYTNGRTFEPRLVYSDGMDTEVIKPVPERL